MRKVTRIIKIHEIKGYKVSCLFNNGASRIIDFKKLFRQWGVSEKDVEYPLLLSEQEFQKVEILEGTFVWKNISIASTDEEGNSVLHFFDVDPIVMYESSSPDPSRKVEIGLMIKQARLELGLTQAELAAKSGTSKHYISRIENGNTGIEYASLIKIIEGGLGKRLQIGIA